MKRILSVLAFVGVLFLPGKASAAAETQFTGQVILMASNFCPTGTVPADGRLMGITQYLNLYSLVGTTYGGNGTTTFAVPTMAPVVTGNGAAMMWCIITDALYPSRP